MIYSATLLDHFRHPRNAGLMRDPDAVGEGEYEGCGDLARVYLRIRDGHAAEVRVQTYGCGPTIAAASAGSELAIGRSLGDLVRLEPREVEQALDGLPDERKHAADVVAAAIRAAARNYVVRGAAEGEPSQKNPKIPVGKGGLPKSAESRAEESENHRRGQRTPQVRGEESRAEESENHRQEGRTPQVRGEASPARESEHARSTPAPPHV